MKDIKQELEKLIENRFRPDSNKPLFSCISISTDKEAILNLMQQAYNLGAESKWISVKDELPTRGVRVLVIDNDGDCFVDLITGLDGADLQWDDYTHWQPLPENPKQ